MKYSLIFCSLLLSSCLTTKNSLSNAQKQYEKGNYQTALQHLYAQKPTPENKESYQKLFNQIDSLFVLAEFGSGGKTGLMDSDGKIVVPAKYKFIYNFNEGLARVMLGDYDNPRYGFINKIGEEIIEVKYNEIGYEVDEGLIPVKLNEKYGYLDKKGQLAIDTMYEKADGFSSGKAAVKLGDKWGYINREGQMVIEPKFDEASFFANGAAEVSIQDKVGYINHDGEIIIDCKYDYTTYFSEEKVVPIKLDGKFSVFNAKGEQLIPFLYDDMQPFHNGRAAVRKNDKGGYIDALGKVIIPLKYDYTYDFSEGVALVKKNEQFGFIDPNGNEITPLRYSGAESFREGLAYVELEGKCGFINKQGEVAIPMKYSFSESKMFINNVTNVEFEGKWLYINKEGKCIRDCP